MKAKKRSGAKEMTVSEYTELGECCGCCDEKVIDIDSKLCEDCESRHTYCNICNAWQDTDWGNGCRHLHWSDHYGMDCGAGAEEGAESGKKQVKELLNLMGKEFAELLEPALREDDFFFKYHGSMLGPMYVEMILGEAYSFDGFGLNDKLEAALDKDDWDVEKPSQLAREGVYWLISLWRKEKDKEYTGAMNKLTADWVKDWLKAKPKKEICARCYGETDTLHPANCTELPEHLLGSPLGMYHCPDCGAMIMAGIPHPPLCELCINRSHPAFDVEIQ